MLEKEDAKKIVDKAIDAGINFFDTANRYSAGRSEEIVGELLEGRREDVVIATKVALPVGEGPNDHGLSRAHILQQIRKSLKRLRTDYVDLYQTHRWDYETPIEETLSTLNMLVRDGKTRYIGASSMWAWQLFKAMSKCEALGFEKFVTMQNHYNLVYREEEREMIPLCKELGLKILPWSPLARGFLTGKYKEGAVPQTARYKSDQYLAERYFRSSDFRVVERVSQVAKEKGVSNAQVALAWLLSKDYVCAPIVGMTKPEHVDEALSAMTLRLNSDEIHLLEEVYEPHPVAGHQ